MKRSLRTCLSLVILLVLVPLTVYLCARADRKYYLSGLVIILLTLAAFFLRFESRRPQAREVVILAVMSALAVASRAVFAAVPHFKPMMGIVMLTGIALGPEAGFLCGAVSGFVSNFIFGQGPWTPWQMFAMGISGFLAGVLFRKGLLRRTRSSMCVFGALCAIVVYGGIMNPASVLLWGGGSINAKMILTYYITGFPMDCIHAFATVFFLYIAAEPMLEKLDRIKVKYGLVE